MCDARERAKTTDAQYQGMNWIRQEKRLAIYLRDGMACCWCGDSVENGAKLSLDHLVPHSKGGSNDATNLVTSCCRCNSSRQDRPVRTFGRIVAAYVGGARTMKDIENHVRNCSRRQLPKAEAKELIARRGSAAKAISAVS